MSGGLRLPTAEVARKVVGTVPYAKRLRVGRLVPPVGITSGDVRGLHELHLHLAPDDRSLPGVDMTALAGWVETAVGDDELAREIDAIAASPSTYVEKCERLHDLVGLRLAQALKILGEGGAG